jgi:hypothetical protein
LSKRNEQFPASALHFSGVGAAGNDRKYAQSACISTSVIFCAKGMSAFIGGFSSALLTNWPLAARHSSRSVFSVRSSSFEPRSSVYRNARRRRVNQIAFEPANPVFLHVALAHAIGRVVAEDESSGLVHFATSTRRYGRAIGCPKP